MLIRPRLEFLARSHEALKPMKATASRGSCFYKVTATKALVVAATSNRKPPLRYWSGHYPAETNCQGFSMRVRWQ
jgi:hypothetical protein